ncbi:guanosine-3',5'-bis(diphosphate) 3'-pyrophosphohydrolase [Dysgonomonas sp. PFB1-18]|uniref:RelA/SpoT family protein n=1 Tax=unclassified Dysgonomonas TaxID=2630389 RepID=UPI002473F3F5|nr:MULTISPECIES: RelA/SpoT family protein [unclassified Dysgonomonas]MDH6309885.1 guanosine-3',5'-bis(diphosphate) 3'-pyrophosphohydrolase [Dysgonomonas sp. PF1-14]MDH6339429.1 guanosine-3',5'-bis(diphosphate) 3'-pyrophosphohydrolase [Dysgonomonas sp. PF1-16]MDH6380928.1 guanosine-3',5'-bis(diphosphate) 3'-pyrophosphohydrolase [Dysgonomonas sp. PFB1-18]MDH6397937.1 guanosine-3',5'-bis(diphosphate) 3'-pyrophosphohydrolase [Dysgonomonas sp. PF1-23]
MNYPTYNAAGLTLSKFKRLMNGLKNNLTTDELSKLRTVVKKAMSDGVYRKDEKIGSITDLTVSTSIILIEELGLKSASIIALILYRPVMHKCVSSDEIRKLFGNDVADIVAGLIKVNALDVNESTMASDNYIKLLITLAEDMRVILIKIASRLHKIRCAESYPEKYRLQLAVEVSYLYTPLAHKLGLYNIKTELEDLYLKYTDREAYDFILEKISESKASRDKYIAEFITPIDNKLKETGLKYDVKGRVKSISSINNKLKKQKIDFESIYDLFAIRIILESPLDKEKAECWQAYSIVTDLYTPNPKRLKDWLSIPKSNGYESLHTTVMGPESRWVEVQIRTRRMDEIAERGLAAHWKYKGVKSQSRMDDWLTGLREMLENKDMASGEKLENFKLDLYDDEIYVFTPKGDLHKLPKGATVLDFAFAIHSRVGSTCVSGKINGKNVSIRHKLKNGDQIEVVTSPNQSPKQDWLNFVTTSKAKNKIRQSLKEEANKQVEIAKEMMKRRVKNRKMEINDSIMMRLIKKLGFKTVTDFYIKIAEEALDVNTVIDQYLELEKGEQHEKHEAISAENYVVHQTENIKELTSKEELVIDHNLTGVDYKLAKCCNPIYGDEIFGFVSSQGIKIHRKNCPNANDMISRFAYRVIPARWTGKSGSLYTVTLRVIGHDDIGIINNLTSIIAKESGINMRSISIDSNDGLFHGSISVMLNNTDMLNGLIKKLKTVKGVKEVSRLS